ncbi:hypothetical protein BGZ83_006813 [Gryganskiella cystojenkinii]|nr:hypothetical protein BGZ83_006813 [Gryganskiella cystojenkinii]
MSKPAQQQHSSPTDQSKNDPEWAPTARAHVPHQRSEKRENNGEGEEEEEDEDEYEKRIERTGCAAENELLQDCYAEKHDWRQCKDAMTAFKDCWKRNGNVKAE